VPNVCSPIHFGKLAEVGGVFSLEHYLLSRTVLWAGHVARLPKSRSPQRQMMSWLLEPRIAGGQEITYGRSLERNLKIFYRARADVYATAFTEWTTLV
jgi:hypothetical protein